MRHNSGSTISVRSCFVLLIGVIVGSPVSAEVGPGAELQKATETVDLLKEESVETIVLDRPVHFSTPEATDAVADPDTYRVVAGKPHGLKLVPSKGKPALIIDALMTSHEESISSPVALYVRDDEKFPHVVLLLPGGEGLEALGSYDAARARGLRSFQLTPKQIQKALKEELAKRHLRK